MKAWKKAKLYKRKYEEERAKGYLPRVPLGVPRRIIVPETLRVMRTLPADIVDNPEELERFKKFMAGSFAEKLAECAAWEIHDFSPSPYEAPRKFIEATVEVIRAEGRTHE